MQASVLFGQGTGLETLQLRGFKPEMSTKDRELVHILEISKRSVCMYIRTCVYLYLYVCIYTHICLCAHIYLYIFETWFLCVVLALLELAL